MTSIGETIAQSRELRRQSRRIRLQSAERRLQGSQLWAIRDWLAECWASLARQQSTELCVRTRTDARPASAEHASDRDEDGDEHNDR